MQMTHGFINLLDDAVKSVASKKDIGSLKKLFLGTEWYDQRIGIGNNKFRKKSTANEEAKRKKLNGIVSRLKVEVVYL